MDEEQQQPQDDWIEQFRALIHEIVIEELTVFKRDIVSTVLKEITSQVRLRSAPRGRA